MPLPPERNDAATDDEIPRYPPFLKGLPLPPIPRLVATQSELIARLRRELALGEDDDGTDRWDAYIAPVIERYAAFVHLIPASEAHHHRGAGGLYRHGLEAAVHAARASRGVMIGLDRPRIEQRRLEPRLRAAAALGGLLHDAGKAIHDVAATDRTGSTAWSPIEDDLDAWATRSGLDRYFLRWREQRPHGGHEVFNVIALKRILPPRVERWLSEPDPALYSGFVAAVTGVPHSSVLVELVREADRRSVAQDLREHRIEPIDTAVGVPVDRYLVDAMRRLLHDGRWQVNVPGARVWLLRDAGLHLVWPAAAKDITDLLAADRVPGIPRDPDTIAELLLERALAVPRLDALGRHPTWQLAPMPLARERDKPVVLNMLRLQEPALLFPFGAPPPVDVVTEADDAVPNRSEPEMRTAPETAAASASAPGGCAGTPEGQVPDAYRRQAASEESNETTGGGDYADANSDADADADDAVGDRDCDEQGTPDAARRWLAGSWRSTARLLDAVEARLATTDDLFQWRDGLLWLRYPEWFETAGWPAAEAAESLSDDGLLEPDPRTPMRRVRDNGGRRWLALDAAVSSRLRALLGNQEQRNPQSGETARPPQLAAEETPADPETKPTDPESRSTRSEGANVGSADSACSLTATIIERLAIDLDPADDSRTRILDHATLKALAKQYGLGVYSLRERLLSDPRVQQDAQKRLIITL
ncbi:MAG: TraI domain-containing protein [Thiohalocapsa sp.]|nr:TraI domain-containing protein [Thiohalocapsa sp.]